MEETEAKENKIQKEMIKKEEEEEELEEEGGERRKKVPGICGGECMEGGSGSMSGWMA